MDLSLRPADRERSRRFGDSLRPCERSRGFNDSLRPCERSRGFGDSLPRERERSRRFAGALSLAVELEVTAAIAFSRANCSKTSLYRSGFRRAGE